jgi:nucleoside-diphosphate-sugar epimerase
VKVLVTGGTGFIGSHLVEVLLQKGIQVRCLLRKSSDLKWIKGLPVEYAWGDCRDRSSLKEAVMGVNQVFHSAGITKAVRIEAFFEINAYGTENLIRACLEHNPDLQKFIYVSSQAAAGPSPNGNRKKETDGCHPVSPYGRSKRLGEELALSHGHKLPILILRPSAVYGPRERDIYFFFRLLSKGIHLCPSNPDQHISLCYVQDVVQAIFLAAETRPSRSEIFFVSDGQDYPIEKIGDAFAQALGIHAFRLCVPKWILLRIASFSEYVSQVSKKPPLINRGKVEEMVQKNWVCDITKAKTVLSYDPGTPLARGARLTVDWYRKENWL